MNDFNFIILRYLVKKLAKTFEQVAKVVLEQRKSNAVIYDIAKTKVVFFSKVYCQWLNKQITIIWIKIGAKKIKFNKKATQWLRIWLDSQLTFTKHFNKKV